MSLVLFQSELDIFVWFQQFWFCVCAIPIAQRLVVYK